MTGRVLHADVTKTRVPAIGDWRTHKCHGCGNVRQSPDGTKYLYQFHFDDGRVTYPKTDGHVWCSLRCSLNYHEAEAEYYSDPSSRYDLDPRV